MNGYDPNFLGITMPLPSFSIDLDDEILKNKPKLTDGMIADYIHYSVVMNRDSSKRSTVFAALNIDRSKFKTTIRRGWRIDKRIGFDNQLDNAYYQHNPWDRGHMARRSTTAWGDTIQEAQRACDATFFYSNSCLQHKNLNQDEWLALEDWVCDLKITKGDKIISYSGAFYGDFDRTITPSGRALARIPTGFFKVVCFINKNTDKVDVRAFVMLQDHEALKDKKGHKTFNNKTYQVTVAEIEGLTGLQFDDAIYKANPLFFSQGDKPDDGSQRESDKVNVKAFPESHEIASHNDIINSDTIRQTINDDIVDIFIASAMVNPEGKDSGNEWVSLINLGASSINIDGWTLSDNNGQMTISKNNIEGSLTLKMGMSAVVKLSKEVKLSNKADVIKLQNSNGERIDWVNYQKHMVKVGKPVLFLSPRDTLKG